MRLGLRVSSKETWIQRLLDILFWIFLVVTFAQVFFLAIVPTPEEWPGKFPYSSDSPLEWQFWEPFIRHWALFNQHFSIAKLIDVINGAFLTIFVYKIGVDVKDSFRRLARKVKPSVYVEWAMGSLISGIIFASARIDQRNLSVAILNIGLVFVFSFVSCYILYALRRKLRQEEKDEEQEKEEEQNTNEN